MYMSALAENDLGQIHDLSSVVSRKILAKKIKLVQHQPQPSPPAFRSTLLFGSSFFILGR